MRGCSRLHADQAGWDIGKKVGYLWTLELLVEQPLTVLVHPVNLEHHFCQIYADCRSLHDGCLSHLWERIFATVAFQMPFWDGATIPLTTPSGSMASFFYDEI